MYADARCGRMPVGQSAVQAVGVPLISASTAGGAKQRFVGSDVVSRRRHPPPRASGRTGDGEKAGGGGRRARHTSARCTRHVLAGASLPPQGSRGGFAKRPKTRTGVIPSIPGVCARSAKPTRCERKNALRIWAQLRLGECRSYGRDLTKLGWKTCLLDVWLLRNACGGEWGRGWGTGQQGQPGEDVDVAGWHDLLPRKDHELYHYRSPAVHQRTGECKDARKRG
ncbi:hypothetical protein CALCODRAFT_103950 [Calocera cornea HHB12733]|uniref:Uncharacterized protein n=1 Tax=Calocera cornea HHB12733 TaxID=1353952 RepID=A0A165D4F8_9BASI|nr:hypothetical protein CALCODRAFT_103950 [Calocera cornea HHB12733]